MCGRLTHLFVYGTLRRGSNNKFARLLHSSAQFAGEGRIQGRLFRLRAYPGAVALSRAGEYVRGELYRIENPRWILAALDGYEGSEFRRVIREVQLDSGTRAEAWVYLYCGSSGGTLIRSGDWLRG